MCVHLRAGLLCCAFPGLLSMLVVPMMWHWVGGGFSAIHGTVGCFMFVLRVDSWLEGTPPLVHNFSFVYKLASPLVYSRMAVSIPGWLLWLVFAIIDIWTYRFFTSSDSDQYGDDTGA